jgi:hypothetical protein
MWIADITLWDFEEVASGEWLVAREGWYTAGNSVRQGILITGF